MSCVTGFLFKGVSKHRAAVLAVGLALCLVPAGGGWNPAVAGPAINQFEMKDLSAEPGEVELQSQNAHSWGQPNRKIARDDGGDLEFDDNSVVQQRHALEMELSLSHFFRMRIGVEFEKERVDDPESVAEANDFENLKFEEVALEGVAIFSRVPEAGGIGFGALAEVQFPVGGGEDLNSIVFGPIVQARSGRWGAIANITFVHFFGNGERGQLVNERDRKWDLAYAGQISYDASENWTYALEAYGTFDRLGNSGMPGEEREFFGDHNQHRAGPLVYYSFAPGGGARLANAEGLEDDDGDADDGGPEKVTIGAGLLFGLNENTPDTTVKWSVEVEF